MSKDFIIHSGSQISKEEIYRFVEDSGGFIQKINENYDQGTIQNEKGVVWIHIADDLTFEDDELEILKNSYNIVPKTSIIISLGLDKKNKRSINLGREFCRILLYQYPNTVADNDHGGFFTVETIEQME